LVNQLLARVVSATRATEMRVFKNLMVGRVCSRLLRRYCDVDGDSQRLLAVGDKFGRKLIAEGGGLGEENCRGEAAGSNKRNFAALGGVNHVTGKANTWEPRHLFTRGFLDSVWL